MPDIETPDAPAAVVEAPPASLAAAASAVAARQSARAPKAEAAPAAVAAPPPVAEPVAAPVKAPKAEATPTPAAAEPLSPLAALEAAGKEDDAPAKTPLDKDGEPVTERDPKAGPRIQELKAEIKSVYKPRITELEQTLALKEARIAELEGSGQSMEEMKAKVAEYEQDLKLTRLEKSPEFVREVKAPLDALQKETDEIVEKYGLDRDEVVKAMTLPDKNARRAALKAATAGLEVDQLDLVDLHSIAERAQPVFARQDELFADVDKTLAELEVRATRETAAQAAARAETRAKDTDTITAAVVRSLPFLSDVADEIAKEIKETDLDALPNFDKAYNHFAGKALTRAKVEVINLRNKLDAALDELAAFNRADPRVDGGLGATAAGGEPPRSLAEAAARAAGMR